MKSVVYFPTFEPPNEKWLKFALLYMDSFHPIIPYSGRHDLSTGFQNIVDNTDLIDFYHPEYDQSSRASIKALEFMEKLTVQPHRYSELFNVSNITRSFTDRSNWNFKLYQEKFTNDWYHYCVENRFGKEFTGGILISPELAFIYMTFLAKEISYQEDKSIITDNIQFDSFLNFKKAIFPSIYKKERAVQAVISLKMPRNINEISFEELISFRNTNRQLIKSFNNELEKTLNGLEDGIDESKFVNDFNDVYKDLTQELFSKSFNFISIPLAFYILAKNQATSSLQYIKEVLAALGIAATTGYSYNNQLKKADDKRNCRNYLTNLSRL